MSSGKEVMLASDYAIMAQSEAVLEVFEENIGDDTLDQFSLDRAAVPAGGGLSWSVPTLEGDEIEVKELVGIPFFQRRQRAYWALSLDEGGGGGNPPDCSSDDAKVGRGQFGVGSEGNPSGACRSCPMGQFGSAKDGKGRGQACQERRVIFLLRPQSLLPLVVSLPPTSMQAWKSFLVRLSSSIEESQPPVPFYGVQIALSLEKAVNTDGVSFSRAKVNVLSRLTADELAQVKVLRRQWEPIVTATRVEVAQEA